MVQQTGSNPLLILVVCLLMAFYPVSTVVSQVPESVVEPQIVAEPQIVVESQSVAVSVNLATPEDAIRYFVDGLVRNNLDQMLTACAIDEYTGGFNFARVLDYTKALWPVPQLAPSEFGLYDDMNRLNRMGSLVNQMKIMVYSFFVPEVKEGNVMPEYGTAKDAIAFAEAVNPQKLKNLKILRIDPPNKDILYNEKNIASFQKRAELYGAQEMTERIVLYELDGKTYVGGFGLFRYGSQWKILNLYSMLANMSMSWVEEITPEAYASLL